MVLVVKLKRLKGSNWPLNRLLVVVTAFDEIGKHLLEVVFDHLHAHRLRELHIKILKALVIVIVNFIDLFPLNLLLLT